MSEQETKKWRPAEPATVRVYHCVFCQKQNDDRGSGGTLRRVGVLEDGTVVYGHESCHKKAKAKEARRLAMAREPRPLPKRKAIPGA